MQYYANSYQRKPQVICLQCRWNILCNFITISRHGIFYSELASFLFFFFLHTSNKSRSCYPTYLFHTILKLYLSRYSLFLLLFFFLKKWSLTSSNEWSEACLLQHIDLHETELILPEINYTEHKLSADIASALFTLMETVTPHTFLLIFPWTRVRITNALAFEIAIDL